MKYCHNLNCAVASTTAHHRTTCESCGLPLFNTPQIHETPLQSQEEKDDPVNHPKHYKSHPSGIECIEITRHMMFNPGNAIKYIWRNGIKSQETSIQDLEKAIWYLQDEIKRIKKEEANQTR